MANKVIRISSNWTGNVRYKCEGCGQEGSAHWGTFHPCPAELSDWQPPMSKPHKPFTVWERDMPLTNIRVFSYWNGKNWMENHTTVEEAAKSRRASIYQYLPWRGLKYDPNLRSK